MKVKFLTISDCKCKLKLNKHNALYLHINYSFKIDSNTIVNCHNKLVSTGFSFILAANFTVESMMTNNLFLTLEGCVGGSVVSKDGLLHQQIASRIGCSHSASIKILKKKKETRSVVNRGWSGCSHTSITWEDCIPCRISLTNHKLTSPHLLCQWSDQCDVAFSTSTVRRWCLEIGLRGCKACRNSLF